MIFSTTNATFAYRLTALVAGLTRFEVNAILGTSVGGRNVNGYTVLTYQEQISLIDRLLGRKAKTLNCTFHDGLLLAWG